MKRNLILVLTVCASLMVVLWLTTTVGADRLAGPAAPLAGAPPVVSYQGQIVVADAAYSGTGYFKFAVVDAPDCAAGYWMNDGSTLACTAPTDAVSLPVSSGLFNVLLGDTTVTNMTALPASVFSDTTSYLRVWFSSTGSAGTFVHLTPDRRIAAVPYALQATNANFLDGQDGSYYLDATNLNAGTLATARYSAYDDLGVEGYLGNAAGDLARNNGTLQTTLNADLLDGQTSADFATALHNHDAAYVNVSGDTMTGTLNINAEVSHGLSAITTDSHASGASAVEAKNNGIGKGLYASSKESNAIEAEGANRGIQAKGANYAGYFLGNVHITGTLSTGGTKPFRIDHPLDPANKYLYHFAVESPEVRNLYQGNAALDAAGQAVVTLPDYFDALNADAEFNYQLTCIGGFAPVYIAEKVSGNQFKIAGGVSGLEVSWQVTAIRNDPYLRDHPVQAEVIKNSDEKGTYQYPEGYGQPETAGADYQRP
ncbi:MAG: hypothetical protein NT169_26460 [Chloroflexi bacterium]|nr:hypothetical protein [Chloroflexota bacterium]